MVRLFGSGKRKPEVGGFIALHGLTEWWLNTFTEQEQRYISERYSPMGLPGGALTEGKWSQCKAQPTAEFLSGLMSWFRSPADRHIHRRIHEKIKELGETEPRDGAGYYKGRHFTTWVEDVKELKQAGRLQELEGLLWGLVEATEADDRLQGCGVAPGYYEELAKLFRKVQDYRREMAILERFAKMRHAPGVAPARLLQRLERAKELLAKQAEA